MRRVLLVLLTVSVTEFVLERHPAFLMAALCSLAMLLYRLFARAHSGPTMVVNTQKPGGGSSKPGRSTLTV